MPIFVSCRAWALIPDHSTWTTLAGLRCASAQSRRTPEWLTREWHQLAYRFFNRFLIIDWTGIARVPMGPLGSTTQSSVVRGGKCLKPEPRNSTTALPGIFPIGIWTLLMLFSLPPHRYCSSATGAVGRLITEEPSRPGQRIEATSIT